MKKQQYFFSFITFISIVTITSAISMGKAFADRQSIINSSNHYHQLRFKTTFESTTDDYSAHNNINTGTAFIYPQEGSSVIKKHFSTATKRVKEATLASTTENPFKALYPNIYTANYRERLLQCPMLSFPFELDNDASTQEWLVSSSTYFCLGADKQGIDHDAHMWLLQKQSNHHYQILMEGDSLMVINNLNPENNQYTNRTHNKQDNKNNYSSIESYLYLNRTQTELNNKCGGTKNKWHYAQGYYQLEKTEYHTRDCDYQRSRGNMMDFYHVSFIKAVKPDADKLMLPFN
jgi:hypothetical protein